MEVAGNSVQLHDCPRLSRRSRRQISSLLTSLKSDQVAFQRLLAWRLFRIILLGLSACTLVFASWDAGKDLNTAIGERTDGQVQLVFELRSRLEYRPGQSFGVEPDLFADFTRFRIGVIYKPVKWVRFVAVGMDARAPLYGTPAPSSARDPMDLHEGLHRATAGYQDGIRRDRRKASCQSWRHSVDRIAAVGIHSREFTTALESFGAAANIGWKDSFISPVKLRTDGWNYPVLGDRVVGTYNTIELQ